MPTASVPMTTPMAAETAHVGQILRTLRSKAGLSTKATSTRAHVSRRRLRDLEAGIGHHPSRLEVGLLMEVLADAIREAALAEHEPHLRRPGVDALGVNGTADEVSS